MLDFLEIIIRLYVLNAPALLMMDNYTANKAGKVKDTMKKLELVWLIIPSGITLFSQISKRKSFKAT